MLFSPRVSGVNSTVNLPSLSVFTVTGVPSFKTTVTSVLFTGLSRSSVTVPVRLNGLSTLLSLIGSIAICGVSFSTPTIVLLELP